MNQSVSVNNVDNVNNAWHRRSRKLSSQPVKGGG